MIRLKRHARLALREARKTAKAEGMDVELSDFTSDGHYRFAVIAGGVELGRFTISSSPKSEGDMVNYARQLTKRTMREAKA